MKAQILPAVQFAFKDEQSRADKLRGLVEFGPYKDLPRAPVLGSSFRMSTETKPTASTCRSRMESDPSRALRQPSVSHSQKSKSLISVDSPYAGEITPKQRNCTKTPF